MDRAKEVDVDVFFTCWMQKKLRKAFVGTWFVLHENDDFVFWGKPVFKRMFSDKRIVDEFFKTDALKLNLEFPDFKSKPGNSVRHKLSELIKGSQKNQENISVPFGFKAKLTETTIDIETPCTKTPKSSVEKPNPIPVKAALALMGRIENEFRLPLCPPTEENLAQLSTVLKAYSLV